MEEKEREALLQIARDSIESAIKGNKAEKIHIKSALLEEKRGAFVTIKTDGKLRGCIGRLASDTPLYKIVSEMAASAATEDSRFKSNRIKSSDLEHLEIEISVLSPLQKIDNPLDLEPGKHGIYIKKGFQNGCFLPQVATETGWTKEEFLTQCCSSKAGLSPNAWKEKDTDVYVFTAEIIRKNISFLG